MIQFYYLPLDLLLDKYSLTYLRIPDAHCNGDMHDALEYAGRIKHEQKDFLTEQGIESIY